MPCNRLCVKKYTKWRALDRAEVYDTVYLIYPNWCGTVPMSVYTFLESCNFSGKKITHLCTSDSSGIRTSINEIKVLCPNAQIGEGLLISGNAVDDQETMKRIKQRAAIK